MKDIRLFFEDHKTLEGKEVAVEGFMGPAQAVAILAEALALYRQMRRGEVAHRRPVEHRSS